MSKKEKEIEYEFDPVKELKGGQQAQQVIWSTKSFDAAVDAMAKGLPLKVNPFIGQNSKLIKPELVIKRTPEEIADYKRCMNDVVYFASKCFVMTPEGLQPIVLRDYQEEYLKHLQDNRFSIFLACRQAGKSVVTAIYCLWKILFSVDKKGLILSKSAAAGVDLLGKIKDMFMNLPYYLKPGIYKWNQHEISFDNNSSIGTEAFSPTAGLGKTINFLILDEFAWCPQNEVELFYMNILPTITTMPDSNVCIMSTQNGFNFFHTLWRGANEQGKKWNGYAPYKVDWYQVPEYNKTLHRWEKRTEAWKEKMIGLLGGEANFYYQYGTQFSASDKCIINRVTLQKMHDNDCKYMPFPDIQKYRAENGNPLDIDFGLLHPEGLYFNPDFDFSTLKTGWFILLDDLAEGGGSDYTTFDIIQLLDKDKFKQVGYWHLNTVDLEFAALEFWLMLPQLFFPEHYIISIEWNTYGGLFYNYLINYNEEEYKPEYGWRFQYNPVGIDNSLIVRYKSKFEVEENGIKVKKTKQVPGVRFNGQNKVTACSLLKLLLEKGYLIIEDYYTIQEIENFEDKNGNGSYAASYGHDDIVMTLAQIPMLQQTAKYKEFCEDMADFIKTNVPQEFYNTFDYSTLGQVNPYQINSF